MRYTKKPDSMGQWRWVLYADNGEPISVSSESYVREIDCDRGIELNKASSHAPVERVAPGATSRRIAQVLSEANPPKSLIETLISGQSEFQKRHR